MLMLEMIFQKKMNIFHVFHLKYLAFGALTLAIIVIADNTTVYLCYGCYK